jgi:hypothetical protein
MAYLKPPIFTRRVFNPLAMRWGISGVSTLVIPGRTTGESQRLPVIPVKYDEHRYLVSTRGESEWVRNLRAADGKGELRRRDVTESVQAVEVPVGERDPIISAYRAVAGKTVSSYFTKLPDPADHPVFRIESRR